MNPPSCEVIKVLYFISLVCCLAHLLCTDNQSLETFVIHNRYSLELSSSVLLCSFPTCFENLVRTKSLCTSLGHAPAKVAFIYSSYALMYSSYVLELCTYVLELCFYVLELCTYVIELCIYLFSVFSDANVVLIFFLLQKLK